jgi:hypothetical protein
MDGSVGADSRSQEIFSDKDFSLKRAALGITAPGAVKIASLKVEKESVPGTVLRVVPACLKKFDTHNWYNTTVPIVCQFLILKEYPQNSCRGGHKPLYLKG